MLQVPLTGLVRKRVLFTSEVGSDIDEDVTLLSLFEPNVPITNDITFEVVLSDLVTEDIEDLDPSETLSKKTILVTLSATKLNAMRLSNSTYSGDYSICHVVPSTGTNPAIPDYTPPYGTRLVHLEYTVLDVVNSDGIDMTIRTSKLRQLILFGTRRKQRYSK